MIPDKSTVVRNLTPTPETLPADKYEVQMYFTVLSEAFSDLAELCKQKAALTMSELVNNEPASDKWKLQEIKGRKQSTIFIDKLREEQPEIYAESLSISASDAEKIIGKDRLKAAVIDEKGFEYFEKSAKLTLKDLKEHLPKSLWLDYVEERNSIAGYEIVPKQPELAGDKE